METLYIQPTPAILNQINKGQYPIIISAGSVIGTAQDLHVKYTDPKSGKIAQAYPDYVEQHVHVTLKDKDGHYVSPDGYQLVVMNRGEKPQATGPVPLPHPAAKPASPTP